ncbi:hypothetical protein WA556_001999 [Blastocystis sp. ATCC 50177/Nand II]
MLYAVVSDLEKGRIEIDYFGEWLSKSVVLERMGVVSPISVMECMRQIAVSWMKSHEDEVKVIPSYYSHSIGMGPNCTKYYLISRKEYILCTATFPNPTLYDTSKPICTLEKGSSNHTLSLSLSAPIAPDADSTLLLLLPRNTQSFSVVSRDWLDLQEVLQNLFLLHEKKETRDYMAEALAQKLTRIFVQDGVLVPRYYNVYRKTPEDNIYWKWSPLSLSSSIGTLQSLLRSICEHLQHEPSAFIFQNPVDAAQFPTYREIITQPMDLSTVLKRVNCGYYSRYGRFHADLLQLFWNGCTFNPCHDIWYQQCVVLKLCYMNIYRSLQTSGLLQALESNQTDPMEGSFIVRGRKREELVCYGSASSKRVKVVVQNREARAAFEEKQFATRIPSFSLVRYPIKRVTTSYEAKTEDEVSLSAGMLVYEVTKEENGMIEVMKMDLVEMGLFPAALVEDCPADGNLWQKLCGERETEEVAILKRGKVMGLEKIRQSTGEALYPVQTQYTDYSS